MVKRYPCQIVLQMTAGILAGRGFVMRKCGRPDGGILLAAAFAAACFCAMVWVRREQAGARKLRQAVLLFFAFFLGAARIYLAMGRIEQAQAGLQDGQKAALQGRIIKKQSKDMPEWKAAAMPAGRERAVSWTVSLADCYIKTADQKTEYGTDPKITNQKVTGHTFTSSKLPDHKCSNPVSSHTNIQEIHSCGNVIVYFDQIGEEPVIGNTIILQGTVQLFRAARNEGNFDERAYYQNQGFSMKMDAQEDSIQIVEHEKDLFGEWLYGLKVRLADVYSQKMPEQEAGILCAMLLGDKSMILQETKKLYQSSGIAHILAISGLHISILGAAVFGLLRKGGAPYPACAAASIGLLLMFGAMTGMGTSTMRAILMFVVSMGAACCGRAYDSKNGLAVAAAYILFENPCALFLAGFQFSFAAVLGVLFGMRICRMLQPALRLTETVYVSMGIQLFTLPLTAWYYFEIPVYAVLLNMLVLPFMALVLTLGLLGGGIGVLHGVLYGLTGLSGGVFAGAALGFLQLACGGLLTVCTAVLRYFSIAGQRCLTLPCAVYVTGQPQAWRMAGCYLLLAGCAAVLHAAGANGHTKQPHGCTSKKESGCVTGRGRDRVLAVQKFLVLSGGMLSLGLLFLRLPMPPEVSVLDVGQGDGIYIHTSDGTDLFVDGGSSDVSGVGTYRILPFLKAKGVADIDYWFISHVDQDHVSGLLELLDTGFAVRHAVFADGVVRDTAFETVKTALNRGGAKIQYLKKGGILRAQQARFTCLAPESGTPAQDRNAQSLVLLYEDSGFSAFFPGDISGREEKAIEQTLEKTFQQENIFQQVTLYKAAHHGSNDSNSEAIIRRTNPQLSIVSCAKDNPYGHPGKDAVRHMLAHSAKVCYTMYEGRIRVTWDKGVVHARGYVPWPADAYGAVHERPAAQAGPGSGAGLGNG